MNTLRYSLYSLLLAGIVTAISLLIFHAAMRTNSTHTDIDSSAYIHAAACAERDGNFKALRAVPYYGLGYALFLVGVHKMFGDDGIAGVVIAQVLLMLCALWFIWSLACNLAGRRAAWIAASFASVSIGYLIFAQFILTDFLLSVMLLAFAERFVAYLVTKRPMPLALAGLALGFSCWVKLAGLFFIYPLLVFVLLAALLRGENIFLPVLVLAGSFFSAVGLCKLFHYQQFGSAHLGTMASVNLNYWFYPNFLAELNGSDQNEERRVLAALPVTEVTARLWRDVKARPLAAAYVWLKNVAKTAGGLYSVHLKRLLDLETFSQGCSFFKLKGSLWQRVRAYIEGRTNLAWVKIVAWGEAILLLLGYLVFIPALAVVWHKQGWAGVLFILGFLGYFLLITGHDGTARFRLMIEGMRIALQVIGTLACIDWLRRMKRV